MATVHTNKKSILDNIRSLLEHKHNVDYFIHRLSFSDEEKLIEMIECMDENNNHVFRDENRGD